MSEELAKEEKAPRHFIRQIIDQDLADGKYSDGIVTRFPPEPNGYLHIGHAKSICLNYGLAQEFGGICNLRFDDTNPLAEEDHFRLAIEKDVKWLGFDIENRTYFSSDYFDQLYTWAVDLIKMDKAFVCELSFDQMAEYRGTPTEPGKESPFRNRPIEESIGLFERMKAGEFEEGAYTLRAKVDMASPNMHMRDPIIYRIQKAEHYRTGDKWKIYPMYDFTHCLSDAIEGITHSICTLEFEVHRPIYEWLIDALDTPSNPYQREFAKLNLSYTLLGKRVLKKMVEEGLVDGWDDPRMPTLSGMKRRGYTPQSIRNFCDRVGVAKRDNMIDLGLLEFSIREDLNKVADRRLAVLNPLKVVITNYDEQREEELDAVNNPEDESRGSRKIPFSNTLYIEKEDFMEDPPGKFFRLGPGREVRLRYAYFITCNEVIKDDNGEVIELHCTYDPESKGGKSPDGRKVKGTLHWVSTKHAIDAEVRLYDRLCQVEDPASDKPEEGFGDVLNPDSLRVVEQAKLEPTLRDANVEEPFQFERLGYFCKDINSPGDQLVFNRTVTLRDSWAKIASKN
ncbi:MAG: glutamine--tRNA ligase/YqeY domain fusion protein [Bacteroidetes bacterium]|nr:glutamine--tRNA ligase/YqeY domain fusion protein [Bacteroidota bacterium]